MVATVPEVMKVLSIPCPKCGALILEYCDQEKQMVCGERMAEVVKNDAIRAMKRLSVHSYQDDGMGRCEYPSCGYSREDPIHQAKNVGKIEEIFVSPSAPVTAHAFEGIGPLCRAQVGNLLCNRPKLDIVHNKRAIRQEKIHVERRSSFGAKTMPVDIMPPGSEEKDPRSLGETIAKIDTNTEADE
jgi:hypothetical protein